MARVVARPRQVTVSYRGILYTLDLERCRRALVWRQVEGSFNNMVSLARACDISRSTASRFFSGKVTSLTVTLKILRALQLKFEEVARPKSEEDDAAGSNGSVGAKVSPQAPQDGAGQMAIASIGRMGDEPGRYDRAGPPGR